MKVLQINTEKGYRGGERQTILTTMGLINLGHEVDIMCLKGEPLSQKALDKSLNVIPVSNQTACFTKLITAADEYDILHAQSAKAFGYAAMSKFFHKQPLIYTRRVDFIPSSGKLTKFKYKKAAAVAAISTAIKEILVDYGLEKVELIPSIVNNTVPDTERARRILQEKNIDVSKKIVGVAAAFTGHKDPMTMVAAAKLVLDNCPEAIFIHFGDGGLRDQVENAVKKADIVKRYILMGHVADVEDFFPLFSVFAMSSSKEGLGSSVLDAFLHRVPVASTDAGGLKNLVTNRGLVCGTGDASGLADNIMILLNDKVRSETFCDRAYDYCLSEHSMEAIVLKYQSLYKKVLSKKVL
ncbi:MAG: glycosyltransferase family 4 protein [Chitinispirillales bacterium]|jgi:glycosyltransferase involved in cell wall biosynthesis|nr:glycosyltransferase family 4 protein [Chitinispirillales bacterium]